MTVGGVPEAAAGRKFRPDIEGLRAVAVLLVVLYHAGVPGLTGGFVGVDVFFVISGFLITTHLVSELERTGRLSLAAFYGRRVRRLLPLSLLVLLVTVVVSWLLLPPVETRATFADARWTALFAMNVRLALQGVDYQANAEPSVLQHYWSLGVEEQFYALWPVVLLLVWWLGARVTRSVARGTARPRLVAAVATGVLSLLSFLCSAWLLDVAQPYAYFLLPARAWELGAGAVVAFAGPALVRRVRAVRDLPVVGLVLSGAAAVGLACVVASAVLYDDGTRFPGPTALLPVLGTALVILAGSPGATPVERHLLGRPAAQRIGRVSYGWYLWHWPALLLVPAVLDLEPSLVVGLVVAAATLALAQATLVLVEDPSRRSPRLRGRVRPLAAAAVASVLLLAVTGLASATSTTTRGDGPAAAAPVLAGDGSVATLNAGLVARAVPANLAPGLDGASEDKPSASPVDGVSCHVGFEETAPRPTPGAACAFGDVTASRTLVLVGDSHAYQWLPALDEVGRSQGYRVLSFTKSGCPVYDLDVVQSSLGRDYHECYAWRDAVVAEVGVLRPDLVVTSGIVSSDATGDEDAAVAAWDRGVRSTVEDLRSSGSAVLVLGDTPYPGDDVPRCVARHLDDASACAVEEARALNHPRRREAVERAAADLGAAYADSTSWLCSEGSCPVVLGDTLVYRDHSHLSATAARRLADAFVPYLPRT
ncbi:SGNH hydrolase domain-containing protein [Kineococcus endophyticus]